jgi:FtsZ-binding cell division protein ZapB
MRRRKPSGEARRLFKFFRSELVASIKELGAEFKAEVKAEVTVLRTEVKEFKAEVTALGTEVKAEVTALGTEVKEVKAEVTVLRTEVKEVKAEVTVLRTEVKEVKAEVTVLRTEVKEVKAEVTVLRTEVKEVKAEVTALGTKVENLRVTQKDDNASMRSTIATIHSSLGGIHEELARTRLLRDPAWVDPFLVRTPLDLVELAAPQSQMLSEASFVPGEDLKHYRAMKLVAAAKVCHAYQLRTFPFIRILPSQLQLLKPMVIAKITEMDALIRAARERSGSVATISSGESKEVPIDPPAATGDTLSLGKSAPSPPKLDKFAENLVDAQGVLREWTDAVDEDRFLMTNDRGVIVLCLACEAIDVPTAWEMQEVNSINVCTRFDTTALPLSACSYHSCSSCNLTCAAG